MPVVHKQALVDQGRFKILHTSLPLRVRLTIDRINGEEVSAEGPQIVLQGLKHGVNGFISSDPFEIRMTLVQCTPVGIFRAKMVGGGASVAYTVRTGVDA